MSWLEAVLACLVLGSWTENGAGIGPGFEAKLPVRVTTCKHRNWLCQIRDLVSEVRMDTLHLIIGSADQRASRQIGAATNADGSALSATETRATSGACFCRRQLQFLPGHGSLSPVWSTGSVRHISRSCGNELHAGYGTGIDGYHSLISQDRTLARVPERGSRSAPTRTGFLARGHGQRTAKSRQITDTDGPSSPRNRSLRGSRAPATRHIWSPPPFHWRKTLWRPNFGITTRCKCTMARSYPMTIRSCAAP